MIKRNRIVIYLVLVVVALAWRYHYKNSKSQAIEEPPGLIERVESVDGKIENVVMGLGSFDQLKVYGNPDGPFEEELHLVHIGEGNLFDIATNIGEIVSIQDVGKYAKQCGFVLGVTRLYIYQSDEDSNGGPLALSMERVVKMRFGEIRTRYIGYYKDEIKQAGAPIFD